MKVCYYWINLDSAKSRYNNMISEFEKNGITNHTRIPAYPSIGETKRLKENACCRSHLQAVMHFLLKSNDPYALICEDDLTFELKQYWKKSVEEVVNEAPNDWGIIQLATILQRLEEKTGKMDTYFKWSDQRSSSCLAWVIHRKCAVDLLNTYLSQKNIYEFATPDCWSSGVYIRVDKYTKYTSYTYKYPMFVYPDDNDSQLDNSLALHVACKREVIQFLKTHNKISEVSENEIPPLPYKENDVKKQYFDISNQKEQYLNDLKIIIEGRLLEKGGNARLEGNSFYKHLTTELHPDLYTKQLNIFWCGMQAQTKICEIGFNAGHSTMLMLLGREKTPLQFTVFDIGEHCYVTPCMAYIKSKFAHVEFEYIEGDSVVTIPKWIENHDGCIGTYDLVHVDGGHGERCVSNDMKNSDLLVKQFGILIVDDTNHHIINEKVNDLIASGKYREVDVLKTRGYPHRVIQKL
jgi:hypothetical protein